MGTNTCCQALPSHAIKRTPLSNLKKVRSVCRPSVCFNWLFISILPFLEIYSSFVSLFPWPWVGVDGRPPEHVWGISNARNKAPSRPKVDAPLGRAGRGPVHSFVCFVPAQSSVEELVRVRFNRRLLSSNRESGPPSGVFLPPSPPS